MNRKFDRTFSIAALAAVLMMSPPGKAGAAEGTVTPGDAGALDEIIVTAQRRSERLQDVPISVSVLTQAAMDAQGVRNIDDVVRLSPSISFSRGATNNNFEASDISIRGIQSNAGAATTGLYIDDTPIQSRHLSFGTFNAYPAVFDIDRVEVLRGPQGTLFGAGSEGGTLRFITPEPSLTTSSVYGRAEGSSTKGGDPSYELGLAGGTVLIEDKLALRASVSGRREGGFIDRYDWRNNSLAEENANSNKTVTARAALKWAVTDNFQVAPSIYYQKRTVDDISAFWQIIPSEPPPSPGPPAGLFGPFFRSGNAIATPNSDQFTLAALKLEWNLGFAQLISNTSYYNRRQSAVSDYTQFDRSIFLGTPFADTGTNVAPTQWEDNQKNWTQEVRLVSSDPAAALNWTVGVFFQHAKENTVENVYDPSLLAFFGVPNSDGYIYRQDPFSSVDKQTALYANLDYKVTEKLKVIAGVRASRAEYRGDATYSGFVLFGPPVVSSGSLTEHPVTPRFGLEYRMSAANMLYLTIAKGFRIGGTNPKVATSCVGDLNAYGLNDVPDTYGSDSLWSYEVGSKNEFAERRVLFNASAYLIKWKNIQQNVGLTNCGFQFTSNLGELRSTGVDFQLQVRPVDGVDLGAAFAYSDARYTKTAFATPDAAANALFPIVSDGDHNYTSPWTATAFSQVTFPLLTTQGYVRLDYQYGAALNKVTPAQNPANGGSPTSFFNVPANAFTSLRFGVKYNRFDVSLFAQNLFNTQPKLGQVRDGVGNSALYQTYTFRPRTIGLTANYRY